MPFSSLFRFMLPMVLLAAIACTDGATAPADRAEGFEPIDLTLDLIDRGEQAPATRERPTLQHLLHEAVDRVRTERGRDAANRLIDPLRTLLRQAREARVAGDFAAARQTMREANLVAARIVLRVLGNDVIARVDQRAAAKIAELEEKLASGDVQQSAQLALLLERAAERRDSVAGLVGAGAYPLALVHAAQILDMLRAASVLL